MYTITRTCDDTQLIFQSGAIPLTGSSFFGRGNAPILTSYVRCFGYEMSLDECSLQQVLPTSSGYHSRQVASVICQGNTTQPECNSGDIRLVGGERDSEGRVEICVDGFWGTVCDSSWDQREALVVCKQSGYGARGKNAFCFLVITTYKIQAGSIPSLTVGATPLSGAYFGEGSGPVLSSISCTGGESHIAECSMGTVGAVNCHHGRDAAVRCQCE